MRKTGILLIAVPALVLADAGVLDYVEPFLGTPVVATSAAYVAQVLEERGWTSIEAEEERVSAVRVGDGRDESLILTFTPSRATPSEIHQDILTVKYTYVPWLERESAFETAERLKAEFDRLAEAFDYLIGPGETEKDAAWWSHRWPDRESSLLELVLEPIWDTRLTASVALAPLREPEGD
ncbi:MAG TPA: hypothetical protein ENN88_01990 [Candidatus Coatesbacteria bacterium]|nr:hypothetical protein [Candidatus Coatesbacteria bacterium]